MTSKVVRLVCAGSLLLGVIVLAELTAAQYRRPDGRAVDGTIS